MVRAFGGKASASNGRDSLPSERQVYASVQRAVAAGMPFMLVMTAVIAFFVESSKMSSKTHSQADRQGLNADTAEIVAPSLISEERSSLQSSESSHRRKARRRGGMGSKERRKVRRAQARTSAVNVAATVSLAPRERTMVPVADSARNGTSIEEASRGLGRVPDKAAIAVVEHDDDEQVDTVCWCSPFARPKRVGLRSTAVVADTTVVARVETSSLSTVPKVFEKSEVHGPRGTLPEFRKGTVCHAPPDVAFPSPLSRSCTVPADIVTTPKLQCNRCNGVGHVELNCPRRRLRRPNRYAE